MEKLVINGGKKLFGNVKISGAKNSALPILSAVLLAEGKYLLQNIPQLRDISTMLKLLETLGVTSTQKENDVTVINTENLGLFTADYDLVRTMRASILVLGPLLAKRGRAKVSLPGGCAIGERPVDLHIKALKQMGAEIEVEHGYINAKCDKLKGSVINFDIVTVTGTENILMAAALAEGTTVIKNAAQEPEVIDLARFLKAMGAKITGEGTKTIEVEGVSELNPVDYSVMTDRIEAGTFLAAVAATGGKIKLLNCPVWAMTSVLEKFSEIGLKMEVGEDSIVAVMDKKPKAVDVTTLPYPGFPTDMQAQLMAVMALSDGLSVITENIFENRFMHVSELKRMGANIKLKDRSAVIKGEDKLTGAQVMASDLRASASLVIAALAAEGESQVHRIYHLDRGYEKFDEKLRALSADIRRERE
ncbi:UDP-N-acetylglucosamine 1-carboxyvinyltransferase [Deferribacteraceae bacterium V6Fe1]|nr:UDP-N-acetylglucosamine 1-carboxyvinyltransferase [Deferribacteraceae bacterium V6Fe1]